MHHTNAPASGRGLPGITGTDHLGFTVPDMEEAHEFLVEVVGCDHVYSLGPFPRNPELMGTKLNVHPEAVMQEIRFYRCFNGANFEVFHYESPDQRDAIPRNSDIGDAATADTNTGLPLATLVRDDVLRMAVNVPLYAAPPGLVARRPWFTRQQIETLPEVQAALRGREIAWMADPVDAMMLHIQGSGRLRVTEPDGRLRTVRVAFSATNEQPYRSIQQWLVSQGVARVSRFTADPATG